VEYKNFRKIKRKKSLRLRTESSYWSQKQDPQKENLINWTESKQNFCSVGVQVNRWKNKLHTRKKSLHTTNLTMNQCLEYRKNPENSAIKNNLIRKWTKDPNKFFTEEDTQNANKYMKNISH
jgi:hypothetical protein